MQKNYYMSIIKLQGLQQICPDWKRSQGLYTISQNANLHNRNQIESSKNQFWYYWKRLKL